MDKGGHRTYPYFALEFGGKILGLLSMATFNFIVAISIESAGITRAFIMATAGAIAVQVGCYSFFQWEVRRQVQPSTKSSLINRRRRT